MLNLQKWAACVFCSVQPLRAHRTVHGVLRMCRKHCTCPVPAAQALAPLQEILLLFPSPFPSPYTLDLLHKHRTCYSVLETPWQCWLKTCSMCKPTSGWGLKCSSLTRVLSDCSGYFLIWDFLAHHCVWSWPLNLSSFLVNSVLWVYLSQFRFLSVGNVVIFCAVTYRKALDTWHPSKEAQRSWYCVVKMFRTRNSAIWLKFLLMNSCEYSLMRLEKYWIFMSNISFSEMSFDFWIQGKEKLRTDNFVCC